MTNSPVPGVTLKTTTANNIHMRYAEAGSGPLVLFASFFFLLSLLFGTRASVRARLSRPVHLRG